MKGAGLQWHWLTSTLFLNVLIRTNRQKLGLLNSKQITSGASKLGQSLDRIWRVKRICCLCLLSTGQTLNLVLHSLLHRDLCDCPFDHKDISFKCNCTLANYESSSSPRRLMPHYCRLCPLSLVKLPSIFVASILFMTNCWVTH